VLQMRARAKMRRDPRLQVGSEERLLTGSILKLHPTGSYVDHSRAGAALGGFAA
jgi:hypothetical protein